MKVISLLFFILFSFSCFAQLGVIQGKVSDSETKELIASVSVGLYEKDSLIRLTKTNYEGFFRLDSLTAKPYDLVVRYVGYPDSTISVLATERDTTSLQVALAARPPCPPYNKDTPCPVCHKRDKVIPIKYGVPTKKMKRQAKRGKIALGLCNFPYCNPHWYCKRDHTSF